MPMIVGVLVGIALLLILAFAVSYAAGWSAGGAAVDSDAAATLGQERKAQLIIGVLLGTGLILLMYGLSEPPARRRPSSASGTRPSNAGRTPSRSIAMAATATPATGAIVPGQGIQAANLTIRRATGDRDDDRKTYDLLTKTIARGRPEHADAGLGAARRRVAERRGDLRARDLHHVRELERGAGAGCGGGADAGGMPEGPSGTGDVLARSLFSAKGCVACHTIQEIPSARGNIGPNLSHLGRVAGTRAPGVSADEYIRQHILLGSNYQYHAPGFQPLMPPFQGQFTPEQLDAMVEYVQARS